MFAIYKIISSTTKTIEDFFTAKIGCAMITSPNGLIPKSFDLIFKTIFVRLNSLSLKYQRLTPLQIYARIRKLGFVIIAHILLHILFVKTPNDR